MKNIQNQFIAILIFTFSFLNLGIAQTFEVNKVYPYISIGEEKIDDAQSLIDLNSRFKSSWIKEYISVEIAATLNGEIKKVVSKNDQLTQAQKELIKLADANTELFVKINYIPENNLKNNNAKEMDFTIAINPKNEATFPDGKLEMKNYFLENGIDKIAVNNFQDYDLAAVKFTISEKGEIINAHIVESSKDEKIDEIFLQTIQNMPLWKPAEFANGTTVSQDFVLTVGNMESCVVNLLNIRQN